MLNLPDFKDSHCYYMEACGKLHGVKQKQAPSQQIAKVRLSGGNAYLRLLQGGETEGHLHVDLARQRYFKARPQATSDRRAIETAIAAHSGKPISVGVFAQFVAMIDEIPSGAGVVFAGPSAVLSTVDKAVLEVGGAHLLVRNDDFVRTVDWQIFRGDSVFVDIVGRYETKVSATYIIEIFERLEAAFETYILGRTADAPAKPR